MPVFPEEVIAPGELGDNLDVPYAYGFRNLRFGSGTDFIVQKMEGLLSGEADTNDFERNNDHGAFPGFVLKPTKIIDCDMKILGVAGLDIESKLALARLTFQSPRKRQFTKLEPLTFWRPGQEKKFINVRCTKRDIPSEFQTARGLAELAVEWQAPDPIIYGVTLHAQNIVIASGSTSNSATLAQDGDYDDGASPIITIQGPATNPVLQNTADENRAIQLDAVLNSTDVVSIDVKRQEVLLNGVPNFSIVSPDNQWWALLPGNNTILYNRASGNTGVSSTATIEWRNTYQ